MNDLVHVAATFGNPSTLSFTLKHRMYYKYAVLSVSPPIFYLIDYGTHQVLLALSNRF